jgi:hypothetical protein
VYNPDIFYCLLRIHFLIYFLGFDLIVPPPLPDKFLRTLMSARAYLRRRRTSVKRADASARLNSSQNIFFFPTLRCNNETTVVGGDGPGLRSRQSTGDRGTIFAGNTNGGGPVTFGRTVVRYFPPYSEHFNAALKILN